MALTLSGENRFPGWMRLYRFWRWSGRYYGNRNPHGVNGFGTPETIAFHEEALRDYAEKLITCRTREDIEALETRLVSRSGAP